MYDKFKYGIPAFPTIFDERNIPSLVTVPGMSLRDYFAARALQGLVVSNKGSANYFAESSYALADAMLKAREVQS